MTASVAIVMPVLNAGPMLRTALQSVADQRVTVQGVLVDGGSRDDTLSIAAEFPWMRVISASGTSIYEALNRAIAETQAPYVVWLNADDALLPGAIDAWLAAFATAPGAGLARGRPLFVEKKRGIYVPIDRQNVVCARPMTMDFLLRGPCAINSICIRRATFDKIGMFDTSFRLAADRDWLLRAQQADVGIVEFERAVYRYLIHMQSATLDRGRRNYDLIRREHLSIIDRQLKKIAAARHGPFERALGRWHAAEVAMLVASLIRGWHLRDAISAAFEGLRRQPSWPLLAGNEFAKRSGARLAGRGKMGR
jgi:GT2 family glycosyltransferase